MFEKFVWFLSVWSGPLLALLVVPLVGLAVYLFLSLKAEMGSLTRRPVDSGAAVRGLTAELEEVRARLSEVERTRQGPAGWNAGQEPLNLNRRGQILRLHRQGKAVSEIASALGVPLGEVELMVKVHDLSRSEAARSEAARSEAARNGAPERGAQSAA